jgi:hypothetical protein
LDWLKKGTSADPEWRLSTFDFCFICILKGKGESKIGGGRGPACGDVAKSMKSSLAAQPVHIQNDSYDSKILCKTFWKMRRMLPKSAWLILLVIFITAPPSWGKGKRPEYAPKEVLIKFREGTSTATIDSICTEIGLEKIKEIQKIRVTLYRVVSEMTVEELIKKYKDHPHIQYIEPNYEYKIDQE